MNQLRALPQNATPDYVRGQIQQLQAECAMRKELIATYANRNKMECAWLKAVSSAISASRELRDAASELATAHEAHATSEIALMLYELTELTSQVQTWEAQYEHMLNQQGKGLLV